MINPLISIVVPVFNVEKYLSKCIESILSQTYKNLDIILVDDGSTDSSGLICDAYRKKDERIRVVHKANGGLSDARNKGIEIAKGEYLSFIDSDDWIADNHVEILFNLLASYSADISVLPLCKINLDRAMLSSKKNKTIKILSDTEAICDMFRQDGIPWCAQGKLFHVSDFCDVSFPVGAIMEDKATIYKLFAKAKRIVFGNSYSYMYLVRQGSIMHSRFSEKRLESFDIQLKLNDFIEQHYPVAISLANTYTVKTAISLLCMMSYSGYQSFEKQEMLFNYVLTYKIVFLKSSGIVDWRFKLIGRALYALRFFHRTKVYESPLYRFLTKSAGKRILNK